MSKFYDQMEALKGIEGDYPDDWMDVTVAAYDEDISEHMLATEEATNRVAELEAEREALIASHVAELNAVKAARYDEIMSMPVDPGVGDSDSDSDSGEDAAPEADDEIDPFKNLFA